MNKYAAEMIGTFAMVFAGTGAIIINDITGGSVTHVGISITFGLVVMAMIYAVGDVSGAHFNPAVTIGFWMARRLGGSMLLPYMMSQIGGALCASALMWMMFAGHPTLGRTTPHGSAWQS